MANWVRIHYLLRVNGNPFSNKTINHFLVILAVCYTVFLKQIFSQNVRLAMTQF